MFLPDRDDWGEPPYGNPDPSPISVRRALIGILIASVAAWLLVGGLCWAVVEALPSLSRIVALAVVVSS